MGAVAGDRLALHEQVPAEDACADVVARLRARSKELERAIYERIRDAVTDPVAEADPGYRDGLRAAVGAVIDHSLEGIGRAGPEHSIRLPAAVAAQARRAARHGVSLGTVLRRCVVGHGRLGELVAEEAERCGYASHGPALGQLRHAQAALLEQLTAAIELTYNEECERIARSPEQRRSEVVRRLLAGERLDGSDTDELDYELQAAWHLGVVAAGAGAEGAVRRLREVLDRRLLLVAGEGDTVWGWLGGPRRLAVADLERLPACANGARGVSLAIGEPGNGLDGWRRTHHQAQAALRLAVRKPDRLARYADAPILAAALENDTLAGWLKDFLSPLGSLQDRRGAGFRQASRAYIEAECNATSAASALKVGRHTVESRLRTVEQLLGRSLRSCLTELDVALRLEELDGALAGEDPAPAG